MSNKPTRNDAPALKERLSRSQEINISVTGRKSGRTISIPVWFVLDGEDLYLLPVQGSDTQWYKNVLNNPMIRIDAEGGLRPPGQVRAPALRGPFLSLIPRGSCLWSRSSATSTGPRTLRSTIRSLTLPLSFRFGDGQIR